MKTPDAPSPAITWRRIPQQGEISSDWCLMRDDVCPSDVVQGQIGDCWILAVLASIVSKNPDLLRNGALRDCPQIIKPHMRKFTIHLYVEKKWRSMQVDNLFPCLKGSLLGAPAIRNQVFVPLLEKAFAQSRNTTSYESLHYGCSYEAYVAILGPDYPGRYRVWSDPVAPSISTSIVEMDNPNIIGCISFKTFPSQMLSVLKLRSDHTYALLRVESQEEKECLILYDVSSAQSLAVQSFSRILQWIHTAASVDVSQKKPSR